MQTLSLQPRAASARPSAGCGAGATLVRRLRGAAERGLAASPLPALLAGRRAAVVLAYHNVVPAGESPCGDRSLHLPQAAFAAQLDQLRATHNVLPLHDLLTAPGPWPRAAITFDDGYAGAATAGVAELAERGLPATLFVVAGAAAGTHFWWDLLAGDDGLDPAVRADALGRLEGRGDAILQAFGPGGRGAMLQNAGKVAFCATPCSPSPETCEDGLPAHAAAAGDDALRAAAGVPGITLGSHAWSHPDLAALGAAELGMELAASLASLRARFPGAIPWISYPYGRVSPAVAAAAREAGYRGGVRVEGGAVRAGDDPLALPRVNVPAGVSPHGFALRARGMEVGRWRASW